MKASELRLGNIVLLERKPRIIKAWDIVNIEQYADKGYKPMPLTAQFLEHVGFVPASNNKFKPWYKGEFVVYEEEVDGKPWFGNQFNDSINVEWQYVHQLQNAYFALIGEELGFKT